MATAIITVTAAGIAIVAGTMTAITATGTTTATGDARRSSRHVPCTRCAREDSCPEPDRSEDAAPGSRARASNPSRCAMTASARVIAENVLPRASATSSASATGIRVRATATWSALHHEGEPMSNRERKKKDGQDKNKKLRRMREDVARRRAKARPERPSRDQADVVTYKQGSAADRSRRGAT